jgi:hypothetical protein
MALDLRGFVTEEQTFPGLYKATDTLERRGYRQDQLNLQREGKKNAAGNFLNNYLDQKDFLTGTNYDPELVRQLQETMQEGAKLASQGADTPTIMMALGPKVKRLHEYSTKAKLIDKTIKDSASKLKMYKGYNTEALTDEAKRLAFYDEKGKLKDISTIDPDQDWLTETVRLHPEKVTSGAGFDDFVAKTPMAESSKEVQTMFGGVKKNVKYDARTPFWMDIAKDEKGEVTTDVNGNPIGLDVMGTTLTGDDGKAMINPETNKPYKVVDQNVFSAIMQHNPDVADYVRGQVNQNFRDIGAEKIPEEGSPQWEMMARSVVYDELKTRDKSFFKTRDTETKSAPVTKIELGYPAYAPKSGSGANTALEGNEFDRINDSLSLEKRGGKLYNKEGEATFSWSVPRSKLPASLSAILKSGGYDISDTDVFHLNIEDGVIQSITLPGESNPKTGESTGGQTITRQDMENAQLKYNTEPQKGEQLKFGKQKSSSSEAKPKLEDLRKKYNY